MIDKITKSCQTFQAFIVPPQRFTVSLLPSEITFNRKDSLELMWIEHRTYLHVVDIERHFSAAVFIKAHTVESGCESF